MSGKWRFRLGLWAWNRWVRPKVVGYFHFQRGPVDPGMCMAVEDVELILDAEWVFGRAR